MNLKLLRTDSSHPQFRELTAKLDHYLKGINGDHDEYFRKLNHVPEIRNVVLLLSGDEAVACGAFKETDDGAVEIKRMFVREDQRRSGHAQAILSELEKWATELGYQRTVLETARSMGPAVGFYQNEGYHEIPNFGPYAKVPTSVCFEKRLK